MKPINLFILLPDSGRVLLELMPDSINGYRIVRKDRITYPRRKYSDLGVAVLHPQIVVGIRDLLPIYFGRTGSVTENVGTVR